eukprot:TRINITY_DN869_c0_g1_i1.p1 TRINITY_DN869_c0_g1~~TRINITY_DN869_c0_g1_i1.p1  ORF type:complete len:173 (-),score=63.76 TRINITY_DN869_c0_g1_i1:120-638(-)
MDDFIADADEPNNNVTATDSLDDFGEAPSSSNTGFDDFPTSTPPPVSSFDAPISQDKYSVQVDEETPLSIYQRDHNKYLDEKSARSEEKRQKLLDEANKTIETFYQRKSEERANKHSNNKKAEDKFVKDNEALLKGGSGNEWERVNKLIDFKQTPVGRDTARLRKLLLELKH